MNFLYFLIRILINWCILIFTRFFFFRRPRCLLNFILGICLLIHQIKESLFLLHDQLFCLQVGSLCRRPWPCKITQTYRVLRNIDQVISMVEFLVPDCCKFVFVRCIHFQRFFNDFLLLFLFTWNRNRLWFWILPNYVDFRNKQVLWSSVLLGGWNTIVRFNLTCFASSLMQISQ